MSDTPHEFSPNLNVAQETLQPFDVREREGLSPMVKLLILAACLLAIAFIVMKLYTPGVRDRSDPPRITADNTPFKVKPEEAGGLQTPNQDKVVFEVMDGNPPKTDVTPGASPEQPIKIDTSEPVIQAPEPVVSPAPVVKRPVASTPVSQPSSSSSSSSSVASKKSDWVVQVASTRSQADAEAVWVTLRRKYPSLVSGVYADVKRADLGEKGIYYRTRIAGLADKSAAQSLCRSFDAAGQACFVTKR